MPTRSIQASATTSIHVRIWHKPEILKLILFCFNRGSICKMNGYAGSLGTREVSSLWGVTPESQVLGPSLSTP